MMSTKGQVVERSLPGKYETTALISEEGIRSEASVAQIFSIKEFLKEQSNVEEFHYL
jgi:hypothetical protein